MARYSEVRPRRSKAQCGGASAGPSNEATRQGRQGEEPQAGDCDRPFGSPQEGQEGAAEIQKIGRR